MTTDGKGWAADAEDRGLWEEMLRRAFASPDRSETGDALSRLSKHGEIISSVLIRDPACDAEPPVARPSAVATGSVGPPGRYHVMGEIARGGIGVVLQARDTDLGRDVAMKVVSEDFEDRDDLFARFIEEARISGQLQHPGIVPVYELGLLHGQRPFFTMKLVRGHTLSDLLADSEDRVADRHRFLRIFEQVCQAVAYAHSRGVVHRDIKPSNVMVGAFGQVQVIDWGLAKVLARGSSASDAQRQEGVEEPIATRDAEESHAGATKGTPAYMAPEQAPNHADQVDERTDVFGLGALLLEILTGQPPHPQRNADHAIAAAGQADLDDALLALENCGADPEIVQLARECLSSHKRDRPRDGGVVAARVQHYLASLEHRAQVARIAAAEERAAARHERRTKRLVVGLASVVLATVVAVAVAIYRAREHRQERESATMRDVTEMLHHAAEQASAGEWEQAIAELRRAEARLNADVADAATRAMVGERLADYRQRAARRALLTHIDAMRRGRESDLHSGARQLEQAFRNLGVDVTRLSAQEIVAALNTARYREFRESLRRALDDWAARKGLDKATSRKLIMAAHQLDGDPWRQRLRIAILKQDRAALYHLASTLADTRRLPESIVHLAQALDALGTDEDREAGLRILQYGQQCWPDHFWINLRLANAGAVEGIGDPDDAVVHARIVVALRPDDPHIRAKLGLALLRRWHSDSARLNDLTQAHSLFDSAYAQAPDDRLVRIGRIGVRWANGEVEEATRAFERFVAEQPDPDLARRRFEQLVH